MSTKQNVEPKPAAAPQQAEKPPEPRQRIAIAEGISEEELQKRRVMREGYLAQGEAVVIFLERLTEFDGRQWARLIAIVDLLNYGDSDSAEDNWLGYFLNEIADQTTCGGAQSLSNSPEKVRRIFEECTKHLETDVKSAADIAERYAPLLASIKKRESAERSAN
jgi:hypothetical protein